jgi:FkbM family methyltransferase
VAPLFWRLACKARVTLDIGAHVGYYSVLAGMANPAGTVFAFEPLPDTGPQHQPTIVPDGRWLNYLFTAG